MVAPTPKLASAAAIAAMIGAYGCTLDAGGLAPKGGGSEPTVPTSVREDAGAGAPSDPGVADDGGTDDDGPDDPPSGDAGAGGSPDAGGARYLGDVVMVATGYGHTCALQTGGTVLCWGSGEVGQLGREGVNRSARPLAVPGISDAVEIAAGGARRRSGAITCWGSNDKGQLGDGNQVRASRPVDVVVSPATLRSVVQITAGESHTCARNADSTLACWGGNGAGEVGNGTVQPARTPSTVTGIGGVLQVGAGRGFSCARRDFDLVCWGDADLGRLGYEPSSSPVMAPAQSVRDLRELKSLSVAVGAMACAISKNDEAFCWGDNSVGQLGDAAFSGRSSATPRKVPIGAVNEIAPGYGHACARMKNDDVFCWGNNNRGQLGRGSVSVSPRAPDRVSSLGGSNGASSIATGYFHSCAVRRDKTVVCWGGNQDGQLGNGRSGAENDSSVPVVVVAP
jgi:alpha-tubulin suppressor-like RCC1 family protein